jgi:hypothetical protein
MTRSIGPPPPRLEALERVEMTLGSRLHHQDLALERMSWPTGEQTGKISLISNAYK